MLSLPRPPAIGAPVTFAPKFRVSPPAPPITDAPALNSCKGDAVSTSSTSEAAERVQPPMVKVSLPVPPYTEEVLIVPDPAT